MLGREGSPLKAIQGIAVSRTGLVVFTKKKRGVFEGRTERFPDLTKAVLGRLMKQTTAPAEEVGFPFGFYGRQLSGVSLTS